MNGRRESIDSALINRRSGGMFRSKNNSVLEMPDGAVMTVPCEPNLLEPKLHELKRESRWLQVLSHVDPQYGGIAVSVPQLARATEEQSSWACPIAGFCDAVELESVAPEQRPDLKIFPTSRKRWMVDASLRSRLEEAIRASSGVHIHGIWETHCLVSARTARRCRQPYIISAHGMLEAWALRHKRMKKALYAALVETRSMQRAACLRALSSDEVHDYRRLGLTNPIAIVPSGVDVPGLAGPDLFLESHPEVAGKRVSLFLGRLHKKKGLFLLLEAWARIAKNHDEVHLVIAGPDSEDTLASLERMTAELGLRSSVTFTGMLTGERKWSAFAAASLFILPSYSEGFSIAVLEALAMGVPVVVTVPCHIPEVAARDCGWVIQPNVEELEIAVKEFLRLSRPAAQEMGLRGKELARQRFDWSVVGAQMAQVYDWVQGGPKPSAVEVV